MKYLPALGFALLMPFFVWAQSDTGSFNIKVFGAEDIVAPTPPASLTATAVSIDQIDVAWGASTDNFVVSGYVVYRNGVAVSTTTLTSYSDVGLAASTTYTYYVRAFDPSFNYSTSSNSAAATTLAPPTPAAAGTQQGTASRVVLHDLRVIPGFSTSTFYIQTARPARFEVRWGRTTSYELGYVVNDRFVDSYETTLTDLEPGTRYEYEVIGYTPFGKASVLERGNFSTLSYSDFLAPANVNRFRAVGSGDDVDLSWLIPSNEEYSYIRIVRSHLHFPTHPLDGAIVYQGNGESYTDEGILSQYSPVYYTAFVVDAAGNVSSGAIAKVYAGDSGVIVRPGEGSAPSSPGNGTVTEPSSDGFIPGVQVPTGTRMPEISEIFLIQNGIKKSFANENIEIDNTQPFVLSIPKDAVSSNLKTIVVTFTDPTDSRQTSSFLLRINKENTAYEAVVAPLGLEGMSRIIIDIYDYKAAVVGTFQKTVTFKTITSAESVPIFPDRIISGLLLAAPLLAALLIGMLIFLLFRRYKKTKLEDNTSSSRH